MASAYQSKHDEDPKSSVNGRYRDRSPRGKGRTSLSRESSATQGPKKIGRSENRSRSPDRKSPISGYPRAVESRKKMWKHENEDIRIRGVLERKGDSYYSEREKRKRDIEDAERERRAKEAAIYNKSLGISPGGGIESGSQQNGRSILQNINNIPQIDQDNMMEPLERDLPMENRSETGTTPHSPKTTSVKPIKVDLNVSQTRASLRLHVTGLFTQLFSEAVELGALQTQRNYVERIFAKRSADYEKALVVQIEFPSAAETTRVNKKQAQKELDRMEEELVKKREASFKLVEEIAEHVIPIEEPSKLDDPSVADKFKKLDEKLVQYREELQVVKDNQLKLDQRFNTLLTEENARAMTVQMQNEMGSVRQEFSACASKVSNFEAQIEQYRQAQGQADLDSRIHELSSKVDGLQEQRSQNDDILDSRSKINELSIRLDGLQEQRQEVNNNISSQNALENLISRVDGLEAVKLEHSTALESINNTQLEHSTALENINSTQLEHSTALESINSTLESQSSAINDRTEISILHTSIKTLSRNDDEIRGAVAKLQNQIRSLEKELRNDRLKMGGTDRMRTSVGNDRPTSESNMPDMRGLTDGLRLAIHDEIKEQQAAVDGILSEKLEGLEGQLRDLAGLYSGVDSSLTALRTEYNIGASRVAIDLLGVKEDISSVKSDTTGSREEVNSLRQHEIQPLQLALNNLDFRMNNLSTEHLARQILAQLEAYLRGNKETYATLELRLQELEKRAAKGEVSALLSSPSSEIYGQIDTVGQQIRENFAQTGVTLLGEITKLRTELANIVSELQRVQGDLVASKTHILEVTSSFKTEVTTINSTSKAMQNDISASKLEFTTSTESLRDEVNRVGLTLQSLQDDLNTSKITCRDATTSLKAEMAKATKTVSSEKRRHDSSPAVRANGHIKRNRGDGYSRTSDRDSGADV